VKEGNDPPVILASPVPEMVFRPWSPGGNRESLLLYPFEVIEEEAERGVECLPVVVVVGEVQRAAGGGRRMEVGELGGGERKGGVGGGKKDARLGLVEVEGSFEEVEQAKSCCSC
jgi:hypothetical protein